MRVIRWILLMIFIVSVTTAIAVRGSGYTGVIAENGKYFKIYKSARYEVSREEYEHTRWRDPVAFGAVAIMVLSLLVFITIESRSSRGGRHITTRL